MLSQPQSIGVGVGIGLYRLFFRPRYRFRPRLPTSFPSTPLPLYPFNPLILSVSHSLPTMLFSFRKYERIQRRSANSGKCASRALYHPGHRRSCALSCFVQELKSRYSTRWNSRGRAAALFLFWAAEAISLSRIPASRDW